MIGLPIAFALVAPQSVVISPVTVREQTPEERAAVAAMTGPAEQGDWRVLSSASEAVMAVDIANILSEDDRRTVWLARAGGRENEVALGAYSLMRIRFDCGTRTAQPIWVALRAASGANIAGQAIQQDLGPYSDASGGAEVASIVCDGQAPTGASFPTDEAFAASVTSH